MDFGENLNLWANAQYLVAKDMGELLDQLKQITFPISNLTFVPHGSRIYAVFRADVKLRKRIKQDGNS